MDATLLSTDGEFPSHQTVKRFFSRCGFRVEAAYGRQEWLRKVRAFEPEVVLIDLDASWQTESAVAALWLEIGRGTALPAVFILGNAPPAALARRTGLPSCVCFQKPVPLDTLLDAVGLAIARIDLERRTGKARYRRRRGTRMPRRAPCVV